MNDRYVLHHEGAWFYYLDEALRQSGMTVLADGDPMDACQVTGWFSAPREAAAVTFLRPRRALVLHYQLDDPDTASARYPLTLTAAQYDQRRNVDDDETLFALYHQVTQPQSPETITADGPWLRLDGTPPPCDGHGWVASLPSALSQRPEYAHLFPGCMPGFRDAMEKRIKGLPYVKYVFERKRGYFGDGLDVTLEIPFDRPVTRLVPALNRDGSASRSRKGRNETLTATRRLTFEVPSGIAGANRAEAAAAWNRAEGDLAGAVLSASVIACSHCEGTGHVIDGSEKHERRAQS